MFDVRGTHILLTQGDTAILTITARGTALTQADRAVFTVRDRPGGRKHIERVLTPDEQGRVHVMISNEDTQNLRAGAYAWDIRYVLEAQTQANGQVTGGREVITPIRPGVMTVMEAVGRI